MKPINSILADSRIEFKKYGNGIEDIVDGREENIGCMTGFFM